MPNGAHTATNLSSLETAIATAIQAISPQVTESQDLGWVHSAENRPVPTAMAHRLFTINWGGPLNRISVFGSGSDIAQGVEMSIVTHYRDVRPERLGIHLLHDGADLLKCLMDNAEYQGGSNEIVGLIEIDPDWTVTEIGEGVYSHDFEISFMKTR